MARRCTICTHDSRVEIDKALIAGEPYRVVAELHEVSRSAVYRHRERHIPKQIAMAQATRADAELGHGQDLLAELENLHLH